MAFNFVFLLYLLGFGALIALILIVVFVYITTTRQPDMNRYESEKYFIDPARDKKISFPSPSVEPTVDVSIIVPSYNEELRLPTMLDEAIEYLQSRKKQNKAFTYEIIVVDDGSTDLTSKVALEYTRKHTTDCVRVLTLAQNRGKGGAVRLGMLSARGRWLLLADADGATKFPDLKKLEDRMHKINTRKDCMAIVCGSRAHLQDDSIAERSYFRTVLMHGFHFVVWLLCVRDIGDTQCGFKLLTRQAALRLFTNLHVNRWAFDVELLFLAQALKIPIAEVPVNWQEIDGSKMVPVFSWIQMGIDLVLIRLRYMLGLWKINDKVKLE